MRWTTRIALAGVASLAIVAPVQAQRMAEAVLTIDMAKQGPRIEPAIQGQFAEHLGRSVYEGIWVGENSPIPNTNGYRNDVLAALKALKVPVVRWPGGCFADEYDWKDGIGPRAKRPKRINTHWGWVTEDNSFGTHEFLNFAEMIGSEAYVAGNMGSMPPIEMARWMEYMTGSVPSTLVEQRKANGRDKPWKVRYFGIGNESWGCGGSMTGEQSAVLHRRYQTFVKSPPGVEPTIEVATGANGDDEKFTEALMRDATKEVQALSIHYYTLPTGNWTKKGQATGFPESEWASTLRNAMHMDDILTRHTAIMDKYDPKGRVALYPDEWGTWYDPEPGTNPGFLYQQNSLRDVHVAALTLNIFHRHTRRVKLAAIAQMVNVLQAMILTDKDKMLLTPTYHAFDLYKPFQGATPIEAKVDGPRYVLGSIDLPMVDSSVARGTDGKLYVSLVNLDPNRPVKVRTTLTGRATGRILTAAAMDTHNTFDKPDTLKPAPYSGKTEGGKLVFELPAKAVAVVAVE